MASNTTPQGEAVRLVERITEYLSLGGLWNPESMNHDKVRDLLIDCRAALAPPNAAIPSAEPEDADLNVIALRQAINEATSVSWLQGVASSLLGRLSQPSLAAPPNVQSGDSRVREALTDAECDAIADEVARTADVLVARGGKHYDRALIRAAIEREERGEESMTADTPPSELVERLRELAAAEGYNPTETDAAIVEAADTIAAQAKDIAYLTDTANVANLVTQDYKDRLTAIEAERDAQEKVIADLREEIEQLKYSVNNG